MRETGGGRDRAYFSVQGGKKTKITCIKASYQESLKCPKLLLLSGHTKWQVTWSTIKKPRSVASCCGSLVKLKDIVQNSLPCVFTFGEGTSREILV